MTARRRAATAALVLLAAAGVAAPRAPSPGAPGSMALHADGLVLGADGLPLRVPAGSGLRRVDGAPAVHGALPGAADPGLAAERGRAWLAAGTVPGAGGPYEDVARTALLDLDLLVLPSGAAVAGWSERWRYAWPRDGAHVAAALAVTGRHERALEVLEHLQAVQGGDGTFAARYRPDRSGAVPDDRGVQLDGTGWALWAVWVWWATAPAEQRGPGLRALRPLVTRSAQGALAHLDPASGLPPASPDYWEVRTSELTLGTAAPWQAGLRAAVPLLRALGEAPRARAAADGARAISAGLHEAFGAVGYTRSVSGGAHDAAVAWLQPPYTTAAEGAAAAVVAARASAAAQMAQPNGGLSPGGDWHHAGIGWTPETAAFALAAAASGRGAEARAHLDWLERHRTPLGSLPEKVGPDGAPATVAPLAWSGALVLLALAELDGAGPPVPPVPPA